MKRSEAITHIVNVLRLTGNNCCDHGRDEQDAEKILKRMEEFGMLPPVEKEHWLDRVAEAIKEEHEENHGYPITEKRKYYALRGASLAVRTTWDIN